jgi:hypothetical protein
VCSASSKVKYSNIVHAIIDIAETSITIEDVVFVVDSAKVKENRQDEMNETPTLVECWASRAAAKQRRGRAGRGSYCLSRCVSRISSRPGTKYLNFAILLF